MIEKNFPKAWGSFIDNSQMLPVIIKTLEKIHDASWSMNLNRHNHYEMIYVRKGNAVFNVAGIDVPMKPNDILIIKPNQAHKFVVKSEIAFEFIVLSFKFQNISDGTSIDTMVSDFIEYVNNERLNPYIHLKLTSKNEIVSVMNRIQREQDKQQLWGDFLSYLLITELFVLISRTLKTEMEQSLNTHSLKLKELLHVAKDYMRKNYERGLSLVDVARYVYLSESYFAHTFKDEFGISPKSYLLKVRIDAAKEFLSNTDMKVSDIALTVGFASQQRFNDMFKKATNMTPLKYRKMDKKNKTNRVL